MALNTLALLCNHPHPPPPELSHLPTRRRWPRDARTPRPLPGPGCHRLLSVWTGPFSDLTEVESCGVWTAVIGLFRRVRCLHGSSMSCVCPSSLFQADWYFMVWTDHIYLSSSVDGHVGSFPILASVHKAAVGVGVFISGSLILRLP